MAHATEQPPALVDEKAIQHHDGSDLDQMTSHKEVGGSDSNEAELYESEQDVPVSRRPLHY